MKTARKSLSLQTIALASALLGASAMSVAGELIDVELLARNGAYSGYSRDGFLPTHFYGGERYVEAVQNQEFRVRLRNRSGERVLAVLSVDGVNAITGQTADPAQKGYVLQPYQTVEIDGWRKSNAQTAAFYFTHIADSYAARTARPDNVGVIGVAAYREQRYYPQTSEHYEYDRGNQGRGYQDRTYQDRDGARISKRSDAAAPAAESGEAKSYRGLPAPSASGAPLGTGHGRREYSPSTQVAFEREVNPYEIESLRYDSRQNLVAMGVIPTRYSVPQYQAPRAFPNEYVPDPGYGAQVERNTRLFARRR